MKETKGRTIGVIGCALKVVTRTGVAPTGGEYLDTDGGLPRLAVLLVRENFLIPSYSGDRAE